MIRIRNWLLMQWQSVSLMPEPMPFAFMLERPASRIQSHRNGNVSPLDPIRVFRLKRKYASQFKSINGNTEILNQAFNLSTGVGGVMLGRATRYNTGLLVNVGRLYCGRRLQLSAGMPCATR